MNVNLQNAVKALAAKEGAGVLTNAARVNEALPVFANKEITAERKALIACIASGLPAQLQQARDSTTRTNCINRTVQTLTGKDETSPALAREVAAFIASLCPAQAATPPQQQYTAPPPQAQYAAPPQAAAQSVPPPQAYQPNQQAAAQNAQFGYAAGVNPPVAARQKDLSMVAYVLLGLFFCAHRLYAGQKYGILFLVLAIVAYITCFVVVGIIIGLVLLIIAIIDISKAATEHQIIDAAGNVKTI